MNRQKDVLKGMSLCFCLFVFLPFICQAQTYEQRHDILFDDLSARGINLGQKDGPHRAGRTGFWTTQGKLQRGNMSSGVWSQLKTVITNADGAEDAGGANGGFSGWPGMDTYVRWQHVMPQDVKDAYAAEYLGMATYGRGSTPNQRMMWSVACKLACETWGVPAVTSMSNASNRTGDPTGKAYIEGICDRTVKYNFEERWAKHYLVYTTQPLLSIAQLSNDPVLANKARMTWNWGWMDIASFSFKGRWAIPAGRGAMTQDGNSSDISEFGSWLMFGGANRAGMLDVDQVMNVTQPSVGQPNVITPPPIIAEMLEAATNREVPFTRRGLARVHETQWATTYMTKDWAMYSQLEGDTTLNSDGTLKIKDLENNGVPSNDWSSERWAVLWDDADSAGLTMKPPTGYGWAQGSGLGPHEDVMQHEGTIVGVINFPSTWTWKYTRDKVPTNYLAVINDSATTGKLFLHYSKVLVAITRSDVGNFNLNDEYTYSDKRGFAVECASLSEYPQSTPEARLAAFKADIESHAPDMSHVNDATPRMIYTTRAGKVLDITYGLGGKVDGDPIDYEGWPLQESPWTSQRQMGNLFVFGKDRTLLWNYKNWSESINTRPTPSTTATVSLNGAMAVDIDLASRVSDAETSASGLKFRLGAATNGSVTMLPDGHTARFTPAGQVSAADFDFTVSDAFYDSRLIVHYDFEQSDPLAGGVVMDQSSENRHARAQVSGLATAAGDSSVPATLAATSAKSLKLGATEFGSAKLQREVLGPTLNFSNHDWTFATWFKRDGYGDDDVLLHIGDGTGDSLELILPQQSRTLSLRHRNTAGALDADLSSAAVLPLGEWHHAAVSFQRSGYNTGVFVLYLDGAVIGTSSPVTVALKQGSTLFIGGAATGAPQRALSGALDDVALYRGRLTALEVQRLATGSVKHLGGLTLTQKVRLVNATTPVPTGLWGGYQMSGWAYGAEIQFNGLTTGMQTDIPLLVTFDASRPGFSYSQFASATGADLRFTDATDSVPLDYEIENWNPSGISTVWVKVPALSASTTIHAYWGNAAAMSASTANVWSNDYAGVWHLTQPVTGATSNTAVAGSGVVGPALQYDGASQSTVIAHETKFNLSTNFEVSGWFKLAAADKPAANNYRVITSKQIDSTNRNWWITVKSDGGLWWKSSDGIDIASSVDVADAQWHHVAAAHQGTTAVLLLDGVVIGTDTSPGAVDVQTASLLFGAEVNASRFFKGTLDEMRVGNLAHSVAWHLAQVRNIKQHGSYTTYGSVSSSPAAPAAPTGLSAGFDGQAVALTWSAAAAGARYEVQVSDASGVQWQTISSGLQSPSAMHVPVIGQAWRYRVLATLGGVSSAPSSEVLIWALAALQSVVATPGNGSIGLNWAAVTGATTYTVQRAVSANGPFTIIASGLTGASYTDSTAANGVTLFYQIIAQAAAAVSAPSQVIAASALEIPPVPVITLSTPLDAGAALEWSAVAGASSYRVKRATSAVGPFVVIADSLLAAEFKDSGLSNGSTYFYVVSAVFGSAESANSSAASITAMAPPTAFTTQSDGAWTGATWSPQQPLAGFATRLSFAKTSAMTSTHDRGTFVLNQLDITAPSLSLSGQTLFFSGTAPRITSTATAASSVSNAMMLDGPVTISIGSSSVNLNGSITGAGSLTKTGAGALVLTAPNNYSGSTTVNAGALNLRHAEALGGDVVSVANAATLELQGGIVVSEHRASITGSGSSGALRNISGANTWAGAITAVATSGITRIGSDAGSLTLSGEVNGTASSGDQLVFQGDGAMIVTGSIDGASRVTRSTSGVGVLSLLGDNTYTGQTLLNGGITEVETISSLVGDPGDEEVALNSSSLGAPTTASAATINMGNGSTTATLRFIGPTLKTDRVINLAGSTGGAVIEQNGSGTLMLLSHFTATGAGHKTLTLRGSSTGILRGNVVGNSASNVTHLGKAGTGVWSLQGPANQCGNVSITAGTLENAGSINANGSFTCASGATYRATAIASLQVSGQVTLAGTLEITPPTSVTPTSTMLLIDNTGSASISGTFAGLSDNSIVQLGDYAWRIDYDGGSGNDVVLSLVATPSQQWRYTHFGSMAMNAQSEDMIDSDGDGIANLLEYAMARNPAVSDTVPQSGTKSGSVLEFIYTKNKSATDVMMSVEWSDDLVTWSSVGVASSVLSDGATTQQIKATIPAGEIRRFMHLKVTRP